MDTSSNSKKTILITGCSSGFGKSTAARFLTEGWNVVATMRTPQTDLFLPSERLLVTSLDVTRPQSISDAIDRSISHFGNIDVLVNNAGIGLFGAHEATSAEVTREIFETNTFGAIAMNRAIIPHMREQGSGTIINVTSSVGIAPMPLVAVYTASKYAIEGFSESLSYELATFGIRVKVVQPGFAPSTAFGTNSGNRCDNLIPSAYAGYATRYMNSMQEYPAAYTTAEDVAEAIHHAAIDPRHQLRYPAGADSVMLAALRQSLPLHEFMDRVRTMTGGASVP